MLAAVSTPQSQAMATALLTDGERPKSSAPTTRYLLSCDDEDVLFRHHVTAAFRFAMKEKNSLPSLIRRENSLLSFSISFKILKIGAGLR